MRNVSGASVLFRGYSFSLMGQPPNQNVALLCLNLAAILRLLPVSESRRGFGVSWVSLVSLVRIPQKFSQLL